MMAKNDLDAPSVWPLLRATLAAMLAIGLFGGAVGAGAALARDDDPHALGFAIVAAFLALAIGCMVYAWRQARPVLVVGPLSPRGRRSRAMLIASTAIGGVLGFALMLAGGHGATLRGSAGSAPLPLWLAVALLVLIGIVIPWVCLVWHRNTDEHEARAYRDGALAGFYAYFFLSLLWWVAWRAQMTPAPDGVTIFEVVMIVSTVVWGWRRYR